MDFSYSPENLEMQRTLRRFIEVHLRVLARNELGRAKATRGATAPYNLVG